jgi:FAD/FMN-containing dehydrogenase
LTVLATVKPGGGYAQAAGHAPFSSKYGLAADNILEYKVVTADGRLVVANSKINTDLFTALRGGGGGTFGVVLEATMNAWPSPKVTVSAPSII